MRYDLVIAIPIGVSVPGTPNQHYLEKCINSLKNQKTNFNYKIVVASDINISDNSKKFLQKNNIDVAWYEPHFYFRKGGIWKKIYDQWEKYDTEYVAFSHYDDEWHEEKLQKQLSFTKQNNLDISWSKVLQINENSKIISGDLANIYKLSKSTIYANSYAFCHSSVVKKQSVFNCGITKHNNNWSGIYEKLFFVYAHKLNGLKCEEAIFYHRVHGESITNTFNNENNINVVNQRQETGYSLNETLKDVNDINLDLVINEIYK